MAAMMPELDKIGTQVRMRREQRVPGDGKTAQAQRASAAAASPRIKSENSGKS